MFGWFKSKASDYERGYAYAAAQLLQQRCVFPRLRSEAEGELDMDAGEHPFNEGMRDAIRHFEELIPAVVQAKLRG